MRDVYSVLSIIRRFPKFIQYEDQFKNFLKNEIHNKEFIFDNLIYFMRHDYNEVYRYFLIQKDAFYASQKKLNQNIQIKTIVYGDTLYPSEFYLMEQAPLILTYIGSASWLGQRCISVVGSREPSEETLEWMEFEFLPYAKKCFPCVVSGGARGVDQLSHQIAIRLQLPTIAILPSGLLDIYPQNLNRMINNILEFGGCLMSEFDLSTAMKKYYFNHRNRLIAALGKMTIIAESKRKSGTMLTARHAVQYGRPLFVVPGHPQNRNFSGSLDLLSEGAALIRDAQDLEMFFNCEIRNMR